MTLTYLSGNNCIKTHSTCYFDDLLTYVWPIGSLYKQPNTSLVPRLPCFETWTLKFCRWEEPGIFSHMRSVKGRKGVYRKTLIACGPTQRLRKAERVKAVGW